MSKAKFTSIGGQALIEGIMMKSPEKTALAVRTPDKSIDISYLDTTSVREKYKILSIPIIRGVAGFIESMIQGYKAMMVSADKSGYTDIEDEKEKKDKKEEKKKDEKSTNAFLGIVMAIGSVLGIILSVVLFMYLPYLIVNGVQKLFNAEFSKIWISLCEQMIKLAVFVLYIWLISFMKDIKRVFMYHGAEHKTIFCYEKGLALTVENVRKMKRFHPRCGTSFMILMILISVIFSTLVQIIFPNVRSIGWIWVVVKILLIPIVCGVGYEVLKACGKYDNIVTKIVSAPGLWIQRLTTKEPHDDMIEIAIAALKACEPENPDVDRSVDKEEIEIKAETVENDDI